MITPIRFAFDTETTGLQEGSRLIELAAVLMDDAGAEIARFDQMVNPGMPLPPDVTAIHGLTDSDLVGKPDAGAVLRDFRDWLADATGSRPLLGIAHFAPYDMGILSWELSRFGEPLPGFQVVDTCEMAKAAKLTSNNKLDTMVEHFAIQREGVAHRARSDVDACRQVFNRLCEHVAPQPRPWSSDQAFTLELPGALAKLPEIVATGGKLSFGYTDKDGARTDREVTPYGWARTSKGVYFHGLCHLRGERRTFRADQVAA